jgi:hypothetical protein
MRMKVAVGWLALVAACQSASRTEATAVAVAHAGLPAGARVVTPAAGAAPGVAGHVATQACVPDRRGLDVAEEVRAALAPEWHDVKVLASTSVSGRWVVVGTKDGQGVSGVIDEVRSGPCAAGEVYVSLGVHEVPAEAGETPVGAPGVRAAGKSRLPVVPAPGTGGP